MLKNPISINPMNAQRENYYKYISMIIIDYICQKENIVIDSVNFNSKEFWCWYETSPEGISIWLEFGVLESDLIECTGKFYQIDKFASTYGIESNEVVYYIWLVLHELGHAVYHTYIFAKLKENHIRKHALDDAIRANIYLALPVRHDDKHEMEDAEFNYNYNPDELLASQYAYLNFYEVWQLLSSMNLV